MGKPGRIRKSLSTAVGRAEPRRQKAMLSLFLRLPMNRLISRMWASTLDRYALSQDG